VRLIRAYWGAISACVALALAFGGCELNPQPEVPAGIDDSGVGGVGAGNAGGSGGLGMGGGNGGTGANRSSDGALSGCAPGCGKGQLCNQDACVDDPCDPNSCEADKACKPNADFTASDCFVSCAGVVCQNDEVCIDGTCQEEPCAGACTANEVCQVDADGGFACGVNPCETDGAPACLTGEVCDPFTAGCALDPCIGVKCPTGQLCSRGQCAFVDDSGSPADAG
jgi:hypothetical protein